MIIRALLKKYRHWQLKRHVQKWLDKHPLTEEDRYEIRKQIAGVTIFQPETGKTKLIHPSEFKQYGINP